MKVTYRWLKDFVDITLPPDKLAEKLTMAGLEVEEIEEKDGDFVYTIEVTSNRPDWLSVLGIAREVAAITGKKLKAPAAGKAAPAGKEKVSIEIEDTDDCPLYTARVIRGVRVGASPEWMRRRLELVGVRPVNNIVDITNYVLFELGEPLHAFDLGKLGPGNILVRRAKAGEKITAIDGKEYALHPEVLLITDTKRPVAIAGVMGGKDTEVTGATHDVLLEAALFDPILVRRGRQKLGLQSEASYRFERGIDPIAPDAASLRAAQLMEELCGGDISGMKRAGSAVERARAISLDMDKVCRVLGAEITSAQAKKILTALGFGVTAKGKKTLGVRVPSFRRDAKEDIDLIEEIARVFGYENLPSELPALAMQKMAAPSFIPLIKETLMAQGLDEVLTYSLIDRKFSPASSPADSCVEICKPLSAEQEIMRTSLSPSLCRVVAYNLNQRRSAAAIFEIARVYAKPDREEAVLGIALSGVFSAWFGPQAGNVSHKADMLHLKGIIDTLFARLGIESARHGFEYRDEFTVAVTVGGAAVGTLKKLNRGEQALFDIKEKDVFLAELSLDKLLSLARRDKTFKPFPRFPSITRDITLELPSNVPVRKVIDAAKRCGQGLMQEADFLDYYDRNLPSGMKRITISCVYAAADRTLTENEINPVNAAVVAALTKEFSAQTR